MKTAKLLKVLEGFTGEARLYELSEPVKGWDDDESRHVVVSATSVLGMPETYIFLADDTGKVTRWGELNGSFKGGLDHAEALRGAGYEVVDG